MKLFSVFILSCLISTVGIAQISNDTIRELSPVEIKANRIFLKEEAGMKQTRVDTLVLVEKINMSLSELLSENSHVFIKSHGRGALASASFRGTASSHTQVNWNGININSPMTGMVDFSLIPVYIIDEMNIKHGSASIADQTGGLGGSIDIVNKVDWNNSFSLKYIQGLGSYKTYNEFLKIDLGNRRFQAQTRIYRNTSKNDYVFENHGIPVYDPDIEAFVPLIDTNELGGYQLTGLLQEFAWKPNNKNIVTFRTWLQWANRSLPRAVSSETAERSNINGITDDDQKSVIEWKHYQGKHKFNLRSGYSAKQLHYELMNYVSGSGIIPAIYSNSWQESLLNQAGYTYESGKQLNLRTAINFDYHNVYSHDSVSRIGYQMNRKQLSVFLAASRQIKERLNVNLMLRQELCDVKWLPLVPYLGMDYRVFKNKNLILKGNLARNYHQPTLNDLYWVPGGNPDLRAEQGISGELGLAWEKDWKQNSFSSALSYYRADVEDWIIWIPTAKGFWEPMNIKRVLASGLETQVSFNTKLGGLGIKTIATYAYTRSINYGESKIWGDESYGKQLVYVPKHSGNLLVHVSYRKFSVHYQYSSYSRRYTTSSNDLTLRHSLYPYFMNDLTFGKELDIKATTLSVKLKIMNLFNEKYHTILYRPMPGRNYMLMLMFKF